MRLRRLAAVALLAAVVPLRPAEGADDATLLRVFLKDGSSLVSYGEPARVGERVVFSMPSDVSDNPPLHLVNLPAEKVDWTRTDQYATAARASHYVRTQGDADYATLSNQIAQALNKVAFTSEPAERLAIAENARKLLVEWPQAHYNYRLADVRTMVSLLDEAIADLRAATGAQRFAFTLSAFADVPTSTEPLLPAPTPKESIDQLLVAAGLVDVPAERKSLLATALSAMKRDAPNLPAEWLSKTRPDTQAALNREMRIDSSYSQLTKGILTVATARLRHGDVRGLERLMADVRRRDQLLGGRRPDAVAALVGALQGQLDAARKLQLARDRWALREPEYKSYWASIQEPLNQLARLQPALEGIKMLSGTPPATLTMLQQSASIALREISKVVPPDEFRSAHALLISAAQLAANAERIRREATLAGDLSRAWDASSAAAGSLMLGARAKQDMQALLKPPQFQ
jgi:hypothetical protein